MSAKKRFLDGLKKKTKDDDKKDIKDALDIINSYSHIAAIKKACFLLQKVLGI